jgi:hypothetical protein E4_22776
MLVNNDKKRYSYNNIDTRNKKFIHKNFNKTTSYHSNFSHSKFINASFIGAKFKFSSLFGSTFDNCYLRGALFRKCNLKECIFKNCIISSSLFENSKLESCYFENCKILNSLSLSNAILHNKENITNEILEQYPQEHCFSKQLIEEVKLLKKNEFIRKSSILHLKKQRIETVSLKVLVEEFGEEFLINNLKNLNIMVTRNFSSLSYITNILKKIQNNGKKEFLGSTTLDIPKLTDECSSTD